MKPDVSTHSSTVLLDKIHRDVEVKSQTVAIISVLPQLDNASADFNINSGAGAHVIFPILPNRGDFVISVNSGAHVVLSLLGKDSVSHELNFTFNLIGEGANVHFQVAVIHTHKSQSKFNFEFIHASPHTYGRMLVRRIILDEARSSLKGMLRVDKSAQSTDTYLSDKALLLGEKTEATSDPRLEILANDVKASHGATIGKLSEEELFYIRSRGIDLGVARGLLALSFLQPALVGVPADLVRSLTL